MKETVVIIGGSLVGKTVAQLREELGVEGESWRRDEEVPHEWERLEFRVPERVVMPFRKSPELKKLLANSEDPVYILRALGPERRVLASGCEAQTSLNSAIRDYVKRLVEEAKTFSAEDLRLAVDAYREGKAALGITNTQRTKWIPNEICEAESAFEDLLEALDGLAHRFPQPVQKEFWKARAFRKYQRLSETLGTPMGQMTVGVARNERDPRWYPFIEWRDQEGEGKAREEKAVNYITAGTLTSRNSLLTVAPLYENVDGRFWGVEVSWTTRSQKVFAWEIRLSEGFPRFSLVREDPGYRTSCEVRQGDVLFSPEDYYGDGEPLEEIPWLVRSCEFQPAPSQWSQLGGEQYVAQFLEATAVVSHPDHRTIKVQVGKKGVRVRPVSGQTHYQPRDRDGD